MGDPFSQQKTKNIIVEGLPMNVLGQHAQLLGNKAHNVSPLTEYEESLMKLGGNKWSS